MQYAILGSMFVAGMFSTAMTQAQDYPTRPLRFITGYLPGGVSDTIARVVGERLGERLGQRVVIDGRPGAGGVLSMELAVNANPDGHTLYLGQPVMTISPNFKRKPPFDPQKALAPVALIGTSSTMLAVHPSMPVNSVKELIAYAKAQPGGVNFGSSGQGATNHLSGELLRVTAGIPLTHVPYRGAAANTMAAIQGEIQISFQPLLAALPHIKAGRLKGIATTGAKRSQATPTIPTVGETLPAYEVSAWYGIVVSSQTPKPIVTRLANEVEAVLKMPDVRTRLESQGVEIEYLPPAPFAELIRKDAQRMTKLVQDAGLVFE